MAKNNQTDNALNSTKSAANLNKRATSYDVAKLAGVSQSAVSRCFKPGASVSKKTRTKVETIARQLGYQPNAIARGLITRRSNIIAVIITELTNLSYPEVLSHLNRKLEQHNNHILLFTLGSESDVNHVLDQVWQYQVDGIIAAARFTDEQIDACQTRQIPLVFYNRIYENNSISSVGCDHSEGERLLINILLEQQRKHFVVLSGPSDSYVSTVRTESAIQLLKQNKIDAIKLNGDYSYQSASIAIQKLLTKTDNVDAIVCANDVMAMGCIDTLRHQFDKHVPDDIAVVGFDGVGAAAWTSYDLTTIIQPVERMVKAAVNMLMERIDSPTLPAEKRLFAGQLRQGSSN